MARKLDGKKVAILVADGFEQVEMTKPREALDEAGAETKIVSLKSGKIQGMNHADKGDKFEVDLTVNEARPEEFDALLIPGGLHSPDSMRMNEKALAFSRHFFRERIASLAASHGVSHRRRGAESRPGSISEKRPPDPPLLAGELGEDQGASRRSALD